MAEDDITLECFNRWKVDDLRKYIRDRGQNVGAKRKAELVAVAFALCQQKAPIVASKEEVRQQVDVDYQSLLYVTMENAVYTLPDPFTLLDGWMSETDGVHKWPSCTYANISEYLIAHDQRALLSRLPNDYKEGTYI